MSGTSTYIQISNYALIEYVYENETLSTNTVKALKLNNNYIKEFQFLNSSSAINITGNVLDRSASRLGVDSPIWAYHDIDGPTPTIQIDPNFTLTDISSNILSIQKYDTVKVHLTAGYDFPSLDGFIIEIQWEEWTLEGIRGKKFNAASQVFIKSVQNISFNPTPLFLGDRFYDRYVVFKVPALSYVNEDFWNSPSSTTSIGYQFTNNNVGFLPNSQIFANVHEITESFIDKGNTYFQIGNTYKAAFNSADQYSYLSCTVKENVDYDYIEYYPTYNGAFIEDYISSLNAAPNGDWIIINQINIYEQVGINLVRTSSNTLLQEDNYNEPSIFRPIIRNASLVFSFTVEYIMRLLNKVDNIEVIRKSSITLNNPKKYGYSLEKINLLEDFTPIKVYNKIEKISSNALSNSILDNEGVHGFGTPKIITQKIYVNNYYDTNYISVDSTTNIGDIIGQIVYPQGSNYIFINKFDNYVKFKVFTKSPDKNQNVTLSFSSVGMNIKLCFIYDDETKIFLDQIIDSSAANSDAGELLFRIDSDISTRLLNSKTREYYIINKNEKGDDVLIYSGKFDSYENKTQILAKINKTILEDLQNKLSKLREAQENINKQRLDNLGKTFENNIESSPTTNVKKQEDVKNVKIIEESTAYASAIGKSIENAIKVAAATSSSENPINDLNIPEVYGVSDPMGASIILASQPKVSNPSKPYDTDFYNRFKEGDISKIEKVIQ